MKKNLAELLLEEPEDYQGAPANGTKKENLSEARKRLFLLFCRAKPPCLSEQHPRHRIYKSPEAKKKFHPSADDPKTWKLPRRRWKAGRCSAYGFRKPSRELRLCQHNPMPAPYSGKTDRNVMRTARFRFSYDSSGKRTSTFLFRTFKRCPAGDRLVQAEDFLFLSTFTNSFEQRSLWNSRLSGCFRRAFGGSIPSVQEFTGWNAFLDLVRTRQYTRSRVSRLSFTFFWISVRKKCFRPHTSGFSVFAGKPLTFSRRSRKKPAASYHQGSHPSHPGTRKKSDLLFIISGNSYNELSRPLVIL